MLNLFRYLSFDLINKKEQHKDNTGIYNGIMNLLLRTETISLLKFLLQKFSLFNLFEIQENNLNDDNS